jgi:peroxisomal membrane protein 4
MDAINRVVTDPQYTALFQTVKSMRNGAVYGGRLRFAHSLVINLLFRRNVPLSKRLSSVFKMTKDHGLILSLFVLLYKAILLSLQRVTRKKLPIYEFFAGSIGGMIVYGNQTKVLNHSIAHQITLYCAARVLLGLGKLTAYKSAKFIQDYELKNHIRNHTGKALILDKKILRVDIQRYSWTAFASISWGLVMYLHRYYPSFLQHSMESSMVYIYDDYKWSDLRSLFGF